MDINTTKTEHSSETASNINNETSGKINENNEYEKSSEHISTDSNNSSYSDRRERHREFHPNENEMASSRINNILNYQSTNNYSNMSSSNIREVDFPESNCNFGGGEYVDANNTIAVDEVLQFIEELRKNVLPNSSIYDSFLENMRDYKLRKIDSYELIESINSLLLNYPELLIKFKKFCPREYDARYSQNFDRKPHNNRYLQTINKHNTPIMRTYGGQQQVNIQNSQPFHSHHHHSPPPPMEMNMRYTAPPNNIKSINHNINMKEDPKTELQIYATSFLRGIRTEMSINSYDKFCKELIHYKNSIENNEDGEKHAFALQKILQSNEDLLEKFYGFLPQPEIDNILNNICVCGNCLLKNTDLKETNELEIEDMRGISNTEYVNKRLKRTPTISNKPCLLFLKLLNMFTQNRCTANEILLFAKPLVGENIKDLEKYLGRFSCLNTEKQINFVKIVGSYRILDTPKNMRFPLNNEAILCSSLTSEEFITLPRTLSRDTIYRTEDEIHSVNLLISRLEMSIEYLIPFNEKVIRNLRLKNIPYFIKSVLRYLYGNSNSAKIINLYNKLIPLTNGDINMPLIEDDSRASVGKNDEKLEVQDSLNEDDEQNLKEITNKRIKKSRNPKNVIKNLNKVLLNRFEMILRKWYLEMEMKNNIWSEVLRKENIEFTKVNNFTLETIITNNHTNHGNHYLGNTDSLTINNSLIRRRNKQITPFFTTQIYFHCASKKLIKELLSLENSQNQEKLDFIFKIYDKILNEEKERTFSISKNLAIFLKEIFSFNKCLTEIRFYDLKVIENNSISYTPTEGQLNKLLLKLYSLGDPNTPLNIKEELRDISELTGNSCYAIMNLRTVLKSFKDQLDIFDEMDFEEGDFDLKLFFKTRSDFDRGPCKCKNCVKGVLPEVTRFIGLKSEEMLSI